MSSQDTALLIAFVALAALLLPIPRWQSFLLSLSGLLLRVTGFAIVIAAAVFCVVIRKSPADFAQSLGSGAATMIGTQPADWLLVVALLVAVLMPVAAFLDFSRRLWRASQRTDELSTNLRRTSTLMAEALDRDAGPGAVLTPERSAELRDALSACSGTASKARRMPTETRSFVRKTLAQLVK